MEEKKTEQKKDSFGYRFIKAVFVWAVLLGGSYGVSCLFQILPRVVADAIGCMVISFFILSLLCK